MQMLIIKLLCAGLAIPASRQRRRLRSLGAARGWGVRGAGECPAGPGRWWGCCHPGSLSLPQRGPDGGGSLLRTLSSVGCGVSCALATTFLLFLAAG